VELREGEFPPCVPIAWVSPGYWEVLGIPSRRGRACDASDAAGLPVAILSANAAERLWPGGDPLQGGVHPSPRRGPPWFRVVGVSGAVHGAGPDRPATESLYLPIGSTTLFTARSTELLVAAPAGAATSLAPALRALMAELDPDTPLTVVGTLEERLAASMVRTSFTLFLLGIAALTALALGVVGLYGVVAYRVGARRGEIGIRMAVGAGRGQVRRLVLAHSLGLVGLGTALGLAASFALSGLLDSLLFGVNPGDPGTLALAALTLVATAAAAAWIPAQRATRIDPVEALRGE
jgi:hypothetical protein